MFKYIKRGFADFSLFNTPKRLCRFQSEQKALNRFF